MTGKKITCTCLCIAMAALLFAQQGASVWQPVNSNGTYNNPVIHADYSDPDALRVGDDYYMTASSFTQVPGLPILHSRDLVNWQLIGHALPRLVPADYYRKVQHGAGVWAPAIRYHNGEFYIYYPDPDFGIYLVKAKKAAGPWSAPKLVQEGKGLIDPCPLWDDNGKVYLVHAFAGSRAGIKSIIVIKELNQAGDSVVSAPVLVYDGHITDPTIEGPKLYKRNGWYYIFAPAGGVPTGWQLVLRSKNIYGPYERKVVLQQGSTTINGPHQGAWVDTKKGEHWFLHFQDKEAYGRVVHLQPLQWINDWPVIGNDPDKDGTGEPVLNYTMPLPSASLQQPPTSDEFNANTLGLQWQWQANPAGNQALLTSLGTLRMFAIYQADSTRSVWNYPHLLGQKIPAESFVTTMKFIFRPRLEGETFGWYVLGTGYAGISCTLHEGQIVLTVSENKNADKNGIESVVFRREIPAGDCRFRITMEKGGRYRFSYAAGNDLFTDAGPAFTALPGKWVGARLAMGCTRYQATNDAGYTDIDWIRFEPR